MPIPTPILIADLLDGNSWSGLGEGELNLPEAMLNRLLNSAQMPLPISELNLTCQSGYFLVTVRLDLRNQGLPLRPEVSQMFVLERVRLDPINKFILLKPKGGLRVNEETLSRSRLSPIARALVTTIIHTPTLLKLVRDRFPRTVNYDNGRLHINLAGMSGVAESLDREIELGHVKLKLLEVLSIRNIEIRKGRVVIRARFEHERLLSILHSPPPEGFYDAPEPEPDLNPPRQAMLPPAPSDESRLERAGRLTRSVGRTASRVGFGIIGRLRGK